MRNKKLLNLDQLKQQLKIPTINTGRNIYLFGHRSGPVSTDMEGLHVLRDEKNRLRLMSGTEFSLNMYRGQTEDHPSCIPKLARIDSIESKMISLCRRLAFEGVLEEHPMVKMVQQIRIDNLPLYIDKEGLAQHYGLATDMLDITSNFDVASFFATCRPNGVQGNFEPVVNESAMGIIYRLSPALMIDVEKPENCLSSLHILGWQPLPRPEQQRAFTVKMRPGQDLCSLPTVEKFYGSSTFDVEFNFLI